MKHRPLLLDLDGTLIDSRRDLAAAMNLLLAELGLEPLPLDVVSGLVGRGARTLVGRALDLADPARSISRDSPSLRSFLGHYESVMLDTTAPFPGVVPGLEALKRRGVPMALVTNKPHAPTVRVLDGLDLARFFDVVLGGDSLPDRKPEPGMLIEAARRLGVPLGDCLMVGDSDVDIEAGRAAGVPSIWCSWGGFHPEQPGDMDLRVDTFDDVVQLGLGHRSPAGAVGAG